MEKVTLLVGNQSINNKTKINMVVYHRRKIKTDYEQQNSTFENHNIAPLV